MTGTGGGSAAAANVAISRQGTLADAPAAGGDGLSFVWVDRQGHEDLIAAPRRTYLNPRLSPDDGRIAVGINDGRALGLWIWDFSLQRLSPLPFGPSRPFSVWSPDGRYLFFTPIGTERLVRRAVDGTGSAESLATESSSPRAIAISRDGKRLIFERPTPSGSLDLMQLVLEEPSSIGTSTPRTSPLLDTSADERNASISPDGRWMAYDSNKTGWSEIYVRPFPNVDDAEHQTSTEGGRTPVWAPGGRELFFVSGSGLKIAAVQVTPAFRMGNPTTLFESRSLVLDGRLVGNTSRTFDVSRDGRFLMLKGATAADDGLPAPGIIVVQHWFEELRARLAAGR